MSEQPAQKSRNWLQRLKDESWEAELLISTVAIFGSIQAITLVGYISEITIDVLSPSQYVMGYFIAYGGLAAISFLSAMFILHFILRAYWVGLVGLNSVFPDYGLEDSAYSEIYTRKILAILPRLEKTINQVDELSSVIFSAAFFWMMTYIYLTLTACFLLIIYNLLTPYLPDIFLTVVKGFLVVLVVFYYILTILANIKKYKNSEAVQSWYFSTVKWASIITFGPLYKHLLQISMMFGSNYKKKKGLIWLIIFILLLGSPIAVFQIGKTKIPFLINQERYFDQTRAHASFYANRIESDYLVTPQIDQDIVTSDILRLFIPLYRYERAYYEDRCGTEPESEDDQPAYYLDCYKNTHEVFLNDKVVSTTFLKYSQPITGQYGIITYLDLSDVKKGSNLIKVIKKTTDPLEWKIPFQYSPRR